MATGEEIITPELIEDVAKNELRALFPIIQAFRVNDMERLEVAMDVWHKEFEIENHFDSILTEIAKKLKRKQGENTGPQNNQAQLTIEAVRWLVEAGVVAETAEFIVKKVQETHENLMLPELKRLAFQLLEETRKTAERRAASKPRATPRSRKKKGDVEQDVSGLDDDIVEQGGI